MCYLTFSDSSIQTYLWDEKAVKKTKKLNFLGFLNIILFKKSKIKDKHEIIENKIKEKKKKKSDVNWKSKKNRKENTNRRKKKIYKDLNFDHHSS